MNPDCLHDRDLTLLHYGEAPDRTTPAAAADHLATCPACQARRARLAADLARIPAPAEPDPVVTTRIVARVNEQLGARHGRLRLPVAGGAAVAVLALVVTFATWPWRAGVEMPGQPQTPTAAVLDLEEAMPDIDFLEELELISDLELLRQIEGV